MSLSVINDRLDLVSELLEHDRLRDEIMSALRRTTDVLRLLQKFSIGRGDADDLIALAKTVKVIGQIVDVVNERQLTKRKIANTMTSSLRSLADRLDLEGPSKLANRILEAIDEEGLSQQHLAEEAEAVGIAELADQIVRADEPQSKLMKREKATSKKTTVADVDPGEIWIMRRRRVSQFRTAFELLPF